MATDALPQMCKVPWQVCVFIKPTFGHHLGNVVPVKLLLRCDCDMKRLFTSAIFFIATKAFKASKRSCPFGLWLETSKHPKEFSIHWGCILGGHRDGDCYIPTRFFAHFNGGSISTLSASPQNASSEPHMGLWESAGAPTLHKTLLRSQRSLFSPLILSDYRHLLVDFKTTSKRQFYWTHKKTVMRVHFISLAPPDLSCLDKIYRHAQILHNLWRGRKKAQVGD